jgi:hypothetical protein
VWAVTSAFDLRGYSAFFRRLRLEHDPSRGWKVVDARLEGVEN